jgi:carbon-monoxide dehydrogenase large subunit
MSTAVAGSTSELLAELRRLCARLPLPQPSWHPYVAQIAACRNDFEQALALAADAPPTLELFAALVDGDAEPAFDEAASPALTAAWSRLEALPLPSGQHPYLDEILPALEAHRLLLVALSQTIAR